MARARRSYLALGAWVALTVGADDVFIHDNLVTNNVPSQPSDVSGGIAVLQDSTNIRVARNLAKRNQPDLLWDETGSATFTNNDCQTSVPPGLCK